MVSAEGSYERRKGWSEEGGGVEEPDGTEVSVTLDKPLRCSPEGVAVHLGDDLGMKGTGRKDASGPRIAVAVAIVS